MEEAAGLKDERRRLDTLREILDSPYLSIKFRFATRRQRLEMFGHLSGPKANVGIPPIWQKRILKMTRPGIEWLMQKWNLPLDEYGYLVADEDMPVKRAA